MNLQDKARFPLTTQDISPEDQAFIDAINLDDLREGVKLGETFSDEQKARLKELEEKQAIRVQAAKTEGKTFTGNMPEEPKLEPTSSSKSTEPPYLGDPQFRLSDEAAKRVAAGHREMMNYPPTKPIDLRKK